MVEDDQNLSGYVELHKSASLEKAAERDYELRCRKQLLDELDYKLREKQFEHTKSESRYSKWTNPLVVAVIIGVLTLIGNVVVSRQQAQMGLEQAKAKGLSDMMISLISTGNRANADSNLEFFYKLGLIEDKSGRLSKYLDEKKKAAAEAIKKTAKATESIDAGPVLPAPSAPVKQPILSSENIRFAPGNVQTNVKEGGDANTPGNHWEMRWTAPGPVTSVSIDPDPPYQRSYPCTSNGAVAVCSGWINGGNTPRVMTVHWLAN